MAFLSCKAEKDMHLENNIGRSSQLKVALGDKVIVMGEVYCLTPTTPNLQTVLCSEDLWWELDLDFIISSSSSWIREALPYQNGYLYIV